MADLDRIQIPAENPTGTFLFRDDQARQDLSDLPDYTYYLGVTSTEIEEGTQSPIVIINGSSKTAKAGAIVSYQRAEFIYNGSEWQEFGDLSGLADLAYVDSASGTYTASGSVTNPTFTGTSNQSISIPTPTTTADESASGYYVPAGTVTPPTLTKTNSSTTTFYNPTANTVMEDIVATPPSGTVPSGSNYHALSDLYSVSGTTLTIKYLVNETGASISRSGVSVRTGDPTLSVTSANAATFSGTKVNIAGTVTASGTITDKTFVGDAIPFTAS